MLEDIRRGKEKAWRELFRTYYRPLAAFALDYVHDLDTAREIVQDLFVHLHEKREQLEIRSSLRSYLYQAVRNRCLNHLEQSKGRTTGLEQIQEAPSTEASIEDQIRKKETEHRIFQVVASLPPKCREIFMMSRVKGLSNGEIAQKLEISKRTVETQVSKALKAIREKIS